MALPASQLTYEDLCRAREDGNRYELIEGELILVAAPSPLHQRVSGDIYYRFRQALAGSGTRVFYAPLDVRFADGSVVQPDIVVITADRAGIVGENLIEGPPSLIVEISSPSSRRRDRGAKQRLYARHGVPEYWFVDVAREEAVFCSDPVDGTYRTAERVTGAARSATIPELGIDVAALFA